MIKIVYVLKEHDRKYYKGNGRFTVGLKRAMQFETYTDAEETLARLPIGFYQIKKLFITSK